MAIKKFQDYESTKVYSSAQVLPRGGYVCKILNAVVCNDGQYVKVSFDIAEGEYKDLYMQKWKNNDNPDKKWQLNSNIFVPVDDGSDYDNMRKRIFKGFTTALEDSNPGYHFDWDEKKFKGMLVGCVFNYREYEWNGEVKTAPNPAFFTSVDAIKKGSYKIPADRLLKKEQQKPEAFMDLSKVSVDESETPFFD